MDRLADRRASFRFEIVGSLWGVLEFNEAARLLNISDTGALIESPIPVALESTQAIRLIAAGSVIVVRARVRHVRRIVGDDGSARCLVGVEFLSAPLSVSSMVQAVKRSDRISRPPPD